MNVYRYFFFLVGLFFSFGVLDFQTCSAQENSCLQCHIELKKPLKTVHAAIALGCQTCHKTVEGKSHPDQKGSIVLTQNMPGLCYSCHDETKFKGKSVHQPVSGGMCTGCHNAHQSNYPKILLKEVPGLCYNCHDESKFKGKSGHTLVGMCMGCHNPHSSNTDKILKSDQPELCYTCHDKAKFTKKYTHAVVIMPGGCSSCHSPHVSNNPALLPKAINQLCLTCHVGKDGRHITTLPGKRVHPVKGLPDPSTTTLSYVPDPNNPLIVQLLPDPKNPGRELSCISCHNPHSSDFRRLFPSVRICSRCHKEY